MSATTRAREQGKGAAPLRMTTGSGFEGAQAGLGMMGKGSLKAARVQGLGETEEVVRRLRSLGCKEVKG